MSIYPILVVTRISIKTIHSKERDLKKVIMRIRQKGEAEIGWIIGVACFLAWLTHIYVCFSGNRWGFLIAGALFFPIAIIHGIGIWFGVW